MNRCGTCCHWDTKGTFKEEQGFGRCKGILDGAGTYAIPQGTLAMTCDHEDYRSWLLTKAEFGCVLWEAKGETE